MRASASRTLKVNEPWPSIVARLQKNRDIGDELFGAAADGIANIGTVIMNGSLRTRLFGWMSMHDLCIQQTDATPYSGPYLRISPLESGDVKFRYVDTAVEARQWQRTVPQETASAQLEAILKQLGWL